MGRALRLRVLAWVIGRQDPVFFQAEAAQGVDYAPSGVVQELERLVELDMLVRHEQTRGERRVYYSRTDSKLWGPVAELVRVIESDSAEPSPSVRSRRLPS